MTHLNTEVTQCRLISVEDGLADLRTLLTYGIGKEMDFVYRGNDRQESEEAKHCSLPVRHWKIMSGHQELHGEYSGQRSKGRDLTTQTVFECAKSPNHISIQRTMDHS